MKTLKPIVIAGLVLLVLGAALVLPLVSRGVSARDDPTWLEAFLARRVRSLATPRDARARKNPVTLTSSVIESGREHFADHCAACHANDGSGQTQIGQSLYPKAPDMRAEATQSLSDGELFYIIENGVRLTGMPAWGTATAEGEEATWHLVHWIRYLPKVTREDLEIMEGLNPRSPQELKEEMEIEEFLQGGEAPPPRPTPPAHEHPEGAE